MGAPITYVTNTITQALVAATPTDVIVDVDGSSVVAIDIFNSGANAIGTTVVALSSTGDKYVTDSAAGTAIGSIASAATVSYERTQNACVKIKFTFTSTSGSTAVLYIRGICE